MASFNDFLEEHRTLPDRARLSLTQFDHRYEPVAVGARLKQVEPLTAATYQPRGSTALLDAIGRTIEDTEARLRKRVEKRARKGKPDEAVAVMLTVRNQSRDAQAILTDLRAFVMRIIEAVAGWAPAASVGVFHLKRAALVSSTAGTFVYQIDFAISDQLRII